MDVLAAPFEDQASTVTKAADGLRRPRPVQASPADLKRETQALADQVAHLAHLLSDELKAGRQRFLARKVDNPQEEGTLFARHISLGMPVVRDGAELLRAIRDKDGIPLNLDDLEKAVARAERAVKRFHEGYPYISPEEVKAILARTPADYITREELARGMGATDCP